jgi:hypothetical protein
MTTEPDENGFYGTPTDCYVCSGQGPASEAEVLCEMHAQPMLWHVVAAQYPDLPDFGADPLPVPSFG